MATDQEQQQTVTALQRRLQAQEVEIARLTAAVRSLMAAPPQPRLPRRSPGRLGLLAVALLTFMLVPIAAAAIPGAAGLISACYAKTNGALRVIDPEVGQRCTNKELVLNWNQTGPAGPAGPQGPVGPQGAAGVNPLRVALLRWYEANLANAAGPALMVGHGPSDLAFDGEHMWVANAADNTVSKLRASDGAILGTYPSFGRNPIALTFDGAYIWVVNYDDALVVMLRPSDGKVMFNTHVGPNPTDIAFNGEYVWVSSSGEGTVTKIGRYIKFPPYPVGNGPAGLAFDGANIWVANSADNTVMKLRPSDGAILSTYPAGAQPSAIVFDGATMWVSNVGAGSVTRLQATDGAVLGTYAVGDTSLVFDGTSIWVSDYSHGAVTKLRAGDGSLVGTYPVGGPGALAFDGAYVWVINGGGDSVTKL